MLGLVCMANSVREEWGVGVGPDEVNGSGHVVHILGVEGVGACWLGRVGMGVDCWVPCDVVLGCEGDGVFLPSLFRLHVHVTPASKGVSLATILLGKLSPLHDGLCLKASVPAGIQMRFIYLIHG